MDPAPPRSVTLHVDLKDPATVSVSNEITTEPNSQKVAATVRGQRVGATVLTFRVGLTHHLGEKLNAYLSSLVNSFGFGIAKVNLTVGLAPILVVAPHPDDEALMASGLIKSALEKGEPVKVVVVTNGDHLRGKRAYGIARQAESVSAMTMLGLQPSDIIFLGYPGDVRGLLYLLNNSDGANKPPYESLAGSTATYGAHGLGNQDFHSWLTGEPARYQGAYLAADLDALLKAFRPQDVYTTSRFDEHPDHRAVYYFLVRAIQLRQLDDSTYRPKIHFTVIHDVAENLYEDFWESDSHPRSFTVNFSGDDAWPVPLDERNEERATSVARLTPPPNLWRTTLRWSQVEHHFVPMPMQTNRISENLKYQVLSRYVSQPIRYLGPFCKTEEVFWQEELPRTELLALSPLNLFIKRGEALVLSVSLVRPALRAIAVALESSDENVAIVPAAVVIHTGMTTVNFPVKGGMAGKATVTANFDAKQTLARVTVEDRDFRGYSAYLQ